VAIELHHLNFESRFLFEFLMVPAIFHLCTWFIIKSWNIMLTSHYFIVPEAIQEMKTNGIQ